MDGSRGCPHHTSWTDPEGVLDPALVPRMRTFLTYRLKALPPVGMAKIMSKMQKGSFYSISAGEAFGISIIIIYYAILAWGYQFDRIYKIQKSYHSYHSK